MTATEGWVRCEDGLPPVGTDVLAFSIEDDLMHTAYRDEIGWVHSVFGSDLPLDRVSHWRSLPEKPDE